MSLKHLKFILLGVLIMEAAARCEDYFRYGAPFWGSYSINSVYATSNVGRVGKAGARYKKWAFNSEGFRGGEADHRIPSIDVYGASETFGLYESPGREYPRQLEAYLQQIGLSYNVVNIALPGLTIGKVAYLRRALMLTRPKFVIVYPTPANYIGVTAPFCGAASAIVQDAKPLTDNIRIYGRFMDAAKGWSPDWLLSALRRISIAYETNGKPVMDAVPQETLQAFGTDMRCVIESIRATGAQPILVTHATVFGAVVSTEDEELLSAWRRFYPQLREQGFLDLEARANEVVRATGRLNSVPVVDAARLIPRDHKYFADFAHFTDLGSALMGSILAQEIARESGNSALVENAH